MKRSLLFAFLLLPMFAEAQTYTFSTLVNFQPTSKHGPVEPTSGLIIDSSGNLYGTTLYGGTHDTSAGGDGAVYEVSPGGVLTVLHNFNAAAGDGAQPFANVVRDSAGNLYGTTMFGGAKGVGTTFKLAPSGHETILHSFTGGNDGSIPFQPVMLDGKGNLYGYTFFIETEIKQATVRSTRSRSRAHFPSPSTLLALEDSMVPIPSAA
jgi:uncharacterized repeat protein (TIGR03803 family)